MPTRITCPSCRSVLRLSETARESTSIVCPKCKHQFDPTAETPRRRAQHRPAWVIPAIAAMVLLTGLLVVLGITRDKRKRNEDVVVAGPATPEKPTNTGNTRSANGGPDTRGTTNPNAGPARRYAVLVGVNKYMHTKLKPLQYAVNDVTEMAELLKANKYETTLLVESSPDDLKPTKANIERSISAVLKKVQPGDTLIVGLAGHGLQFEGETDCFFCPLDAKPFSEEKATLVSIGRLYEEMDRSFNGIKVLLMDACRDDPKGTRGVRGADAIPDPPNGVAAMFSCSAGQQAYEFNELKHGVFFHYVLEGLRGKAKNTRGEVTFSSLQEFVTREVDFDVPKRQGGGASQKPNVRTNLSGATPVLIGPDASIPPTAEAKLPPSEPKKADPLPPKLAHRILPVNEVLLKAGRSATVDIKVERRGVTGPLTVECGRLPAGVTAKGAVIPAGKDQVTVTLESTKDANVRTGFQALVMCSSTSEKVEATLPITIQKLPPREIVFDDNCDDKTTKMRSGQIGRDLTFKNGAIALVIPPKKGMYRDGWGVSAPDVPSGNYECEMQTRFQLPPKGWATFNFSIVNDHYPEQKVTWALDSLRLTIYPDGTLSADHSLAIPEGKGIKSEPATTLWTTPKAMKPADLNTITFSIQDNRATWKVNGNIVKQHVVSMNGRGEDLPKIHHHFSLGLFQDDATTPASMELHNVRITRLN